jgi:hypothetical protein
MVLNPFQIGTIFALAENKTILVLSVTISSPAIISGVEMEQSTPFFPPSQFFAGLMGRKIAPKTFPGIYL